MAASAFSTMDKNVSVFSTLVSESNKSNSLTEEEMRVILTAANEAKAALYTPVIVYMILLTILGSFGNILVCCVYCSKPTKTSSHFFIVALAVFDLLTCLIGMPTEVADLRYPLMFFASPACKLLRFIESVTTFGSSIVLIAVAVDRYLRICKLGRQILVKPAKRICLAAMVVGILLSWPTCFLFGKESVRVTEEVYGQDCSTDDSMKSTIYPSIYYGFLGLLFVGCITFFTIIYCSIGLQIWRQKRAKIGERVDKSIEAKKSRTFSNSSTRDTDIRETTTDPIDNGSDPISTDMSSDQLDESYKKRKSSKDRRISAVSQSSMKAAKKRQIKVTRTTVVLFAVTVAYIVSYLPFLILMVVRSIKKDFEETLSPTAEVAYKFCLKSYFINNAINPVIYSFLNMNFRKDASALLKGCCASCYCRTRTK